MVTKQTPPLRELPSIPTDLVDQFERPDDCRGGPGLVVLYVPASDPQGDLYYQHP